jgi:putative ABC transport system permease protein
MRPAVWGPMRALDALRQDLRHSLRGFRRSPAFTAAAVAALTLGIGANTAIFSVVNAVLLKPVSFPDADRIVMFLNTSPQGQGPAASPAKFQHYRDQADVVQDVAAVRTGVVNLTGGSFPEQLRSGQVSADFFRLLGAPVQLGRTFSAAEDSPNGPRAVVLSDAFWKRRFSGDPGVLGQTVSLGGEPFTVVGVLGPGFDTGDFGAEPEVWTPFQLDPNTRDQGHYFRAMGRLKAGVSFDQARARIEASAAQFREKFPTALQPENGFTIQPLRESLVSNVRSSLLVLVGAVSFVLLIACANVASLLLVRATGRRREIAIRAAIGAGRGRIVRQLLTESVLLSLVGGVLGLAAGVIGIRALLAINTAGLPRVGENGALVGIDWRVVLFTMAVALATGILFGLIPALQGSRADLGLTLKESGARSGSSVRQNKTRAALVVAEIALAVILLVGSALLIRTSVALASVDPGYDTSNVLTMRMSLTGPRFQQSQGVSLMVRDGIDRLRAVPGIEQATAACCVPLEGGYGLPFIIVGRPLEGTAHGGGGWLPVSEGYFDVFRIPVKRGRAFTERDNGAGPPVVIINEAMAKQFWPEGDPLADRLAIGRGVMREFADEPERQIVGIVGDVRDNGLNVDPQPKMYVPQAQVPDAANALNVRLTPMAWIVRTRVDPRTVSTAVQEQLRQAAGLPVSDVRTMDEVVLRSTSRERFNMWLMTVFGVCALLLAAIGIYGLMAYSVAQRTQEIGIRLALGAEVGQVRRMVVLQGVRLTLVGVGVGIALALAMTRFIASLLYGVEAWDPAVFVVVPILLSLVALFAVWLPALRASRVSPLLALRVE